MTLKPNDFFFFSWIKSKYNCLNNSCIGFIHMILHDINETVVGLFLVQCHFESTFQIHKLNLWENKEGHLCQALMPMMTVISLNFLCRHSTCSCASTFLNHWMSETSILKLLNIETLMDSLLLSTMWYVLMNVTNKI